MGEGQDGIVGLQHRIPAGNDNLPLPDDSRQDTVMGKVEIADMFSRSNRSGMHQVLHDRILPLLVWGETLIEVVLSHTN